MKIGSKLNLKQDVKKYSGSSKKVSVIIPNYNYENFIVDRIDSVLNQSYPIAELIILDDCSTDNSVKVIEERVSKIDNRINVKFIKNKKNSGNVFLQWKKGIEEASNDYFWIAEADDLCSPYFLEKVMKAFDDKKVVLSYCDSLRMDENNVITHLNSQDLYNIFGTKHWDEDYVVDGKEEIVNYLSSINTIVNVSSIVWKKGDFSKILDEARNFKVAGDWYVYSQILKKGKVAFCHESLNYFRKHSKSVSTMVKADIEYEEICRIQEEIANEYKVPMEIYEWQRLRRNYMDSVVSKEVKKKKIAFVIPHPGKGSGGHRTIIQNVNALIRHGYECDIYVEEDFLSTAEEVKFKIDDYYEKCAAKVYVGIRLRDEYDLLFATGWTTIEFVKNLKCARKAYFVQDFEPWFHAMGDAYLSIENSYTFGWHPITIGKWLSSKMLEYGNETQFFDFCADTNVYKKLPKVEKEKAICYIYQPEKSRRCQQIGLASMKLIKTMRPDIKIYFYGSNAKFELDFDVEKLGIIPIEKCNELYNKCKIGVCFSASNPSRIPFEMMAAGLPVIELYRENNLYDFPEAGIELAQASPEAVATAVINLIDDESKLKKMSETGIKYMKDYPLEKGFDQFLKSVDNIFNETVPKDVKINKMYNKNMIVPSKEVLEHSQKVFSVEFPVGTRGPRWRKLKQKRNLIKGKMHSAVRILDRIIDKF